ncbi:MAG: DUF1003 domain-containing protein [Chloroflexota bacterium]
MRRLRGHHHVDVTHETNANDVHEKLMRPDERLGLWITERVGTMGFFGLLAFWIVVWVIWNVGPIPHFDPGPAFVILLLVSNFIQLLLMPLIMVGQNVQSRHQEIQSDVDHKTLMYLRQINETQLEILEQMKAGTAASPVPTILKQ